MFSIRNIKVSLKVKSFALDNVTNCLRNKDISYKVYPNFISFKLKHNYIIFKSGRRETNHINITKIKDFKDFIKAIVNIQKIYPLKIQKVDIDNIIATGNLSKTINLQKFSASKKYLKIKYNSETFPGLFIRFERGTVILFHTGKFVVVGCKDVIGIQCITQNIYANIWIPLWTWEKAIMYVVIVD